MTVGGMDSFFMSSAQFVYRQPRPQGLPRGGARAEEDPGKIR